MDNKKPVFWLHDITVTQARTMGQNGAHLKFKVKQGKASFDVVAFNKGHLLQEFQQAQGLELAVTLSVNVWNARQHYSSCWQICAWTMFSYLIFAQKYGTT